MTPTRMWALMGAAAVVAVAVVSTACPGAARTSPTDAGADAQQPAAWATWPMPNPATSGLPNPPSYDTSVAGVVSDRVTGLVWQRPVGADALLWSDAAAYCADLSLGGADDWRLPSLIELVSLVDFSQVAPSIDGDAFPETVGGTFWTSTPVVGSDGEAWYVAFSDGFTYQGHQDFLFIRVRCVRGPLQPPSSASRYGFPNAETVLDVGTRLTWQRTIGAGTYSWEDANAACQSLDLAGIGPGGWRLPSMKELQTLADFTRQIPALDPDAFPDAPTEQYWTSSALAGTTTDAWYVSLRNGAANTNARDTPSFARCVR